MRSLCLLQSHISKNSEFSPKGFMSEIQIIPVTDSKTKKEFINFPYELYKNASNWIAPLKMERKEFLSPKKNPYFQSADVQFFIAKRDGQVVGRISAQVNREHNKRYNEKTGHFGLFECVNDSEVARALFQQAEQWLRLRGMNKIVGPYSLSINEESGLLIEGFNSAPYPFMPHNFSYYENLISTLGFSKVKDLIAWNYDITKPIPEVAQQIADAVREYPNLTIREVDQKNIRRDVRIISDVFNSAWSKNWGFLPWSDAEIEKMAKDFKMILNPRLALIAEVNGVPAAISIAIPNYHEAIADLKGSLFPFGLFKLIYRLKTNKVKSARLCLLGIKKEFRNDVLAGLSVCLYAEMHKRAKMIGMTHGELSWTLDDNEKINNGIALMGGEPYKKFRIFEKAL